MDYLEREKNKMATIRKSAKEYVSKTTKNISELKEVNTEMDISEKTFNKEDGTEFTINVIEVDGEEYRVPASVLKQLKVLIEQKPGMTKFKVMKTGSGKNDTSYQVIPLD
jgi:hypothetical protein